MTLGTNWKGWLQLGLVATLGFVMPSESSASPTAPWIYYDGQTGPGVECVQLVLIFCAGQQIAYDGVYGPATRQSVMNLQRVFQLSYIDGVVGPETGDALKILGNSTKCIIPLHGHERIFDLYQCQQHVPTRS